MRAWLARGGQASAGDATLLYQRMFELLKRRGYQKPAWSTSTEFAASLPRAAIGKIVKEFTITYNAWPFGGRTEVAPAPHCCSKSWSACRADAGRQTRKTTLILKFNQG